MVLKLSASSARVSRPCPCWAWEQMLSEMLAQSVGRGVFCLPRGLLDPWAPAPGSSDSTAWAEAGRGHPFTRSFIHSFIIHALIYSFKSLVHSLTRSFTDALIHPFTHSLSFIHSLTRLPIPALLFWLTTPSIHFRLCRFHPTPHPLHNYLHCLGSCLPHPLPWLECQLQAILS